MTHSNENQNAAEQSILAINDAMRGKQMDNNTFGVSFHLYAQCRNLLDRAQGDGVDGVDKVISDEKFDSALKGAAVLASIGRDEATMTPADSISIMFQSIIGARDERVGARNRLFEAAMANIAANKNVMPLDSNESGDDFPLPFDLAGMVRLLELSGAVVHGAGEEEGEQGEG